MRRPLQLRPAKGVERAKQKVSQLPPPEDCLLWPKRQQLPLKPRPRPHPRPSKCLRSQRPPPRPLCLPQKPRVLQHLRLVDFSQPLLPLPPLGPRQQQLPSPIRTTMLMLELPPGILENHRPRRERRKARERARANLLVLNPTVGATPTATSTLRRSVPPAHYQHPQTRVGWPVRRRCLPLRKPPCPLRASSCSEEASWRSGQFSPTPTSPT
mmetsp:Transcript_52672/g.112382  ORF Transcript_52672/g.112382 Transcript_52672/m.112382 type:complete len:212 (-) Transcript_52672:487-1122(-)